MPTPIIVMTTAARTEMNEATDMLDTCFSVRGRQATNEMTKPTTPNTIEQVPWSVMVFMATVNVRMWLAMMNTTSSSCPVPSTSRPIGPAMTSPASAMLLIWG